MSTRNYRPEEWLTEIEEGLKYRQLFGLEERWGELEAIYYNVHESMMNDGPNIFLSQGDAMLSTLTVPSPRVRVTPVKPEEVAKAPLVETLDNVLLRELNVAQEVDTAALHTYLFGRGFLKVGYDSEWGYAPDLDIAGDLRFGATLTQLDRKGTRRIEYDSTISPGSPWVRAVMPHDIVVPWGTRDLHSAPWIAHRVVRRLDDLRADEKYTIPKALEPQLSMEDFIQSYRTAQANKLGRKLGASRSAEYIEFYEIHDRCTGRIYVVTWDVNKYLRNDQNALQIDNVLPFTSMSFIPRSRSLWVTPDVYYLYYIQNELSDTAVQRTKQRRISTLKFLYDESTLEEEELSKILSPEVGVAAKIQSGGDLSRAIQPIAYSPNQALVNEEELLRANAREQIGFSRNQLGEYTGGRKTAREVNEVGESSRLRMSRRGLQVKRLYEDTIRCVNNIVFSYWNMPRYLQVLGAEKSQQWQAINGPSLRGRYDYSVEFVDEGDLVNRKLSALQLYSQLAPDPSVDPIALREFLINQFNDPSFERIFNADVRRQVQLLQQNGGTLPSTNGRGGQRGGGVQALQRPDGQSSDASANAAGLLARGRVSPGTYS